MQLFLSETVQLRASETIEIHTVTYKMEDLLNNANNFLTAANREKSAGTLFTGSIRKYMLD